MKKLRLFTIAAFAALVSFTVVSCGDDQYSIPEEKGTTNSAPDNGTENSSPGNTEKPGQDTIPATPSTPEGEVWTDDIMQAQSDTLYGMWEIDTSKYDTYELAADPMTIRLSFIKPVSPIHSLLNLVVRLNACNVRWMMDYDSSYYRYNKTTGEIKSHVTGVSDGFLLKGTFIKSDETHAVLKYRLHKVVNGEPIDTLNNNGVDFHEWQMIKTKDNPLE